MSVLRLLALLALCCAMDLAAPVAPAPAGIEFDDEEELVHVRRPDAGKRPADDRTHQESLRQRARLNAPRLRATRIQWSVPRGRPHIVVAADRAAPPAPSPEDH